MMRVELAEMAKLGLNWDWVQGEMEGAANQKGEPWAGME